MLSSYAPVFYMESNMPPNQVVTSRNVLFQAVDDYKDNPSQPLLETAHLAGNAYASTIGQHRGDLSFSEQNQLFSNPSAATSLRRLQINRAMGAAPKLRSFAANVSSIVPENTSNRYSKAIATDLFGNVYIYTGFARLMKISPDGQVVWAKYFTNIRSHDTIHSNDIGILSDGINTYVLASTYGPGVNPSTQNNSVGLLVFKVNEHGMVVWQKYVTGSNPYLETAKIYKGHIYLCYRNNTTINTRLVKLSIENGSTVWNKRFTATVNNKHLDVSEKGVVLTYRIGSSERGLLYLNLEGDILRQRRHYITNGNLFNTIIKYVPSSDRFIMVAHTNTSPHPQRSLYVSWVAGDNFHVVSPTLQFTIETLNNTYLPITFEIINDKMYLNYIGYTSTSRHAFLSEIDLSLEDQSIKTTRLFTLLLSNPTSDMVARDDRLYISTDRMDCLAISPDEMLPTFNTFTGGEHQVSDMSSTIINTTVVYNGITALENYLDVSNQDALPNANNPLEYVDLDVTSIVEYL